jgi:Flp pilus assembly protein TadD
MSLISEALKKLERQPDERPSGSYVSGHAPRGEKKRLPGTLIVLAVCLLLVAASGVYLRAKFGKKERSKAEEIRVSVALEDGGEKSNALPAIVDDVSKGQAIEHMVKTGAEKGESGVQSTSPPTDARLETPAFFDGVQEKESAGKVSTAGRIKENIVHGGDKSSPSSTAGTSKKFEEGKIEHSEKDTGIGEKLPVGMSGENVVRKEVPAPEKEEKLVITKSASEKTRERELRHFNDGVRNLEIGDLSRAARNFLLALEYNPENVDALCNLSVVSMRLGEYNSAHLYVSEALKISPTHVRSLNNAGVLNLKTGRYEKALGAFKKALIYDKDNADVLANLALLYYKIGVPEKAIHYGMKSAKVSPGNPEAWYNLGLVYYQRDNRYQAGDAFSKFLALIDENDPRVSPVKDILEAIE